MSNALAAPIPEPAPAIAAVAAAALNKTDIGIIPHSCIGDGRSSPGRPAIVIAVDEVFSTGRKLLLSHAAQRTPEILRHLLPGCSRGNASGRVALLRIIFPAAYITDILHDSYLQFFFIRFSLSVCPAKSKLHIFGKRIDLTYRRKAFILDWNTPRRCRAYIDFLPIAKGDAL